MSQPTTATSAVLQYHERTKHHPQRYARSLGYLDWETQPDPFRRFEGAPTVPLARPDVDEAPPFESIYDPSRVPVRALDRNAVSSLFFDALALSAWKEYEASRWSLRCNPSSGNLHPTEAYWISDAVPGLFDRPTVAHYAPFHHALELRAHLDPGAWRELGSVLPGARALVGLTSIHWRESWKYGERAYRYCQHDVGHAVAAIAFAAALLGYHARLLVGVGDATIARLLRVDEQTGIEAEHPDLLLALVPADLVEPRPEWSVRSIPADLVDRLIAQRLPGSPNRLSADHHEWPILDAVAGACEHGGSGRVPPALPEVRGSSPPSGPPARRILRSRRSAVDMDGTTSIPRATFEAMLHRLLPARGRAPFATLPWRPAIHPILFVHRVDGLEPGLYVLVRAEGAVNDLKAAMRTAFAFEAPPAADPALPLFLLKAGACRSSAQLVSCQQEIAANGAFAIGMLAEFAPRLAEHGPWFYRALHWEAGALGQVLYLEAEAASVRATGIGCFFDDVMHQALGLAGARFQTIYHFTVGGAVEDERLRTVAAYAHLDP